MSEQLTLTIEAKVLGQRKPIVASWSVMVPPAPATTDGDHRMTLRALLTAVVTDEAAAFHERQQERRLVHVLTGAEMIERDVWTRRVLSRVWSCPVCVCRPAPTGGLGREVREARAS